MWDKDHYFMLKTPLEFERRIFTRTKEGIIAALEDILKSDDGVAYWPNHKADYPHKDEIELNARETISKVIEEIKKKSLPNLEEVTDATGNPIIYYIQTENSFYMYDSEGASNWIYDFHITRLIYSDVSLNDDDMILPEIEADYHNGFGEGEFLYVSNFGIDWETEETTLEDPIKYHIKIAKEPLTSTKHWDEYKPDKESSNLTRTVQFNADQIFEYIEREAKDFEIPQKQVSNIEKFLKTLDLPDFTGCYTVVTNNDTGKNEARPYIYATAVGGGYENGYGSIRIYSGVSPYSLDETWSYENPMPFEFDDDKTFKELELIANFPITSNSEYYEGEPGDTYFKRFARVNIPFLYREKQIRAKD